MNNRKKVFAFLTLLLVYAPSFSQEKRNVLDYDQKIKIIDGRNLFYTGFGISEGRVKTEEVREIDTYETNIEGLFGFNLGVIFYDWNLQLNLTQRYLTIEDVSTDSMTYDRFQLDNIGVGLNYQYSLIRNQLYFYGGIYYSSILYRYIQESTKRTTSYQTIQEYSPSVGFFWYIQNHLMLSNQLLFALTEKASISYQINLNLNLFYKF